MKNIIRILTTPSCWLRHESTNKYWDKKLNEMLDNPEFTNFGSHTVKLNGIEIWVQNKYYSSAGWYKKGVSAPYLPKRSTVFRFHDLYEKAVLEYVLKQEEI